MPTTPPPGPPASSPRQDPEALLLEAVRQRQEQRTLELVQRLVHRRGLGALARFQQGPLGRLEDGGARPWLEALLLSQPRAALPLPSGSLPQGASPQGASPSVATPSVARPSVAPAAVARPSGAPPAGAPAAGSVPSGAFAAAPWSFASQPAVASAEPWVGAAPGPLGGGGAVAGVVAAPLARPLDRERDDRRASAAVDAAIAAMVAEFPELAPSTLMPPATPALVDPDPFPPLADLNGGEEPGGARIPEPTHCWDLFGLEPLPGVPPSAEPLIGEPLIGEPLVGEPGSSDPSAGELQLGQGTNIGEPDQGEGVWRHWAQEARLAAAGLGRRVRRRLVRRRRHEEPGPAAGPPEPLPPIPDAAAPPPSTAAQVPTAGPDLLRGLGLTAPAAPLSGVGGPAPAPAALADLRAWLADPAQRRAG